MAKTEWIRRVPAIRLSARRGRTGPSLRCLALAAACAFAACQDPDGAGSAPSVYAGGYAKDGSSVSVAGYWNGLTWHPLPNPLGEHHSFVNCLEVS
ncbi:MAG TPA: hypothetical protein PLI66_09230, partial [Spirochaetales bacterium]|nr:hypothetical protein [Spirochaetales bacterium]